MHLAYRQPPLIEALCELRFVPSRDSSALPQSLIPGRLYDRLAARYPRAKELMMFEPEVTNGVPVPVWRTQLLTADASQLVQVGANLLTINSLRPHVGWHELRDAVLSALTSYREVAQREPSLASVLVRYINRIDLPASPSVHLEHYFKVLPQAPSGLPDSVAGFLSRAEFVYDVSPPGILRFTLATAPSDNPSIASFFLDLEHIATGANAPGLDGLAASLDAAHGRIASCFHGTFTDQAHAEIFQGGPA